MNDETNPQTEERDEPRVLVHLESYRDRTTVLEVQAPDLDISLQLGPKAFKNLDESFSNPAFLGVLAQILGGLSGARESSALSDSAFTADTATEAGPAIVFLPRDEVVDMLPRPGLQEHLTARELLAASVREADNDGADIDLICATAQDAINTTLLARSSPFQVRVFPGPEWVQLYPPFWALAQKPNDGEFDEDPDE